LWQWVRFGATWVSNGQLPVTEQVLRQIEGFVAAVNRKRGEKAYKYILQNKNQIRLFLKTVKVAHA